MPAQIFNGQVNDSRNPNNPAFQGIGTPLQDNVTGDDTLYQVLFDVVFDNAGNFAASVFTAPVTGRYLLSASVDCSGLDATHVEFALQIVTTDRTYIHRDRQGTNSNIKTVKSMSICKVADMDAGHTARVKLIIGGAGGTKIVDISGGSYTVFSGSLVC